MYFRSVTKKPSLISRRFQNKSLDELKDLFTKSIEQDAIFFDDEYLEKSLDTNFISYTHGGAVERYLMEYMGYAESYAYAKAFPL